MGVFIIVAGLAILALFWVDAWREREISRRVVAGAGTYRGIPQESARRAISPHLEAAGLRWAGRGAMGFEPIDDSVLDYNLRLVRLEEKRGVSGENLWQPVDGYLRLHSQDGDHWEAFGERGLGHLRFTFTTVPAATPAPDERVEVASSRGQVAVPAADSPLQPNAAVAAPTASPDSQAVFGLAGEITLVARAENRDRLVGYRFKENDEIAVPEALGRFTNSSDWGYSPELKAWARANHVDVLFHFGDRTIEIIQLDLCDGFVSQAWAWDSVQPAQAWLALKELEAKQSTPPAATLGGWGYRDDRKPVCVYRTREGDTGIYQLRGLDSDRARGVEIRRKQILSPKAETATP